MPTSPETIQRLQPFKDPLHVLDHGFVRLVDVMGDEADIAQAARVSYKSKATHVAGPGHTCKFCGVNTLRSTADSELCSERNARLIRRLMRDRHTSPLEMCEIKLHVKMPIFVARQWIRHRTANVNEISGRYSELPAEWYVPSLSRLREGAQPTTNKQGSEGFDATVADKALGDLRSTLDGSLEASDKAYRGLLESGLSRELARGAMTVSHYTEWYWKIDLHNLLHFMGLRLDHHAQYEIRVYADEIWRILGAWMPSVTKFFREFRLEGQSFSGPEMAVVRELAEDLFVGGSVGDARRKRVRLRLGEKGATPREINQFLKALEPRNEP